MNFINEYALLVAVTVPVMTVLGAQVALYLGGERGTLLLPGFNRYPTIERVRRIERFLHQVETMQPANDAIARIAA